MTYKELQSWLRSGEHLPSFMRDFHDQKDLFKEIHARYGHNAESRERMPDWVSSHCYTVDWFLWFMASRGYTLQRTRKKLNFMPIPDATTPPDARMDG